jgi:hypothetical protein
MDMTISGISAKDIFALSRFSTARTKKVLKFEGCYSARVTLDNVGDKCNMLFWSKNLTDDEVQVLIKKGFLPDTANGQEWKEYGLVTIG